MPSAGHLVIMCQQTIKKRRSTAFVGQLSSRYGSPRQDLNVRHLARRADNTAWRLGDIDTELVFFSPVEIYG